MLKYKKVSVDNGFFKNVPVFSEKAPEGSKALRTNEIVSSIVEIEGVRFNSDENSVNRMDRVIELANWKFNQAVATGVSVSEAYTSVYVETLVPWKNADNEFVDVSVETLCKVQEIGLHKLSEIWVKYG